ncbi:diphosphomevalonate decarboxylase [Gracilimonas sp.]|uniref:diphosphomevalonate decarboxylase n=1 Tax=Gracilimonas sp. TaxID=1974203 RepID=UPI0028728DEA|nr:diphosphomevalonate decarboxylase [Gracilimonas sp.]
MENLNHSDIEDFKFEPVTTVAHSNIALIKYWGKRSVQMNLPAVGSISLTLDALHTQTTLQFDESLDQDVFSLNEKEFGGKELKRISDFLDLGAATKDRPKARINSRNNFPTGAGLASSASGFAALALAVNDRLGLNLNDESLSAFARMGSGSAARSIYGGFAEMKLGSKEDGSEDIAVQLYGESHWDIRLLVVVTSTEKKKLGSTEGMNRTAQSAPYYKEWISSQSSDLDEMRNAISAKDFEKVGELTEHSCFKMHGLAMSARPPILYWNAATTETIHKVWKLRQSGIPAYVTIDAGPQVKILCLPDSVDEIKKAVFEVDDVEHIIEAKPGPAAKIVTPENEIIA